MDATVRVSLNRTNLSIVADKAIAEKMPRCIPETIFKDGKIHGFRLSASSKGYLWSTYSVDSLSRITVSSSRYPMLGINRNMAKFGMVEAASVEQEGDTIVVILPEERPEARHVHKRRPSTRKRNEDHAAPGQPFPKAAPTRPVAAETTEVPFVEITGVPDDEFTLPRIREAVQYLQRAQSSPQWSGLKFNTDEMGVLHAEIHWSI